MAQRFMVATCLAHRGTAGVAASSLKSQRIESFIRTLIGGLPYLTLGTFLVPDLVDGSPSTCQAEVEEGVREDLVVFTSIATRPPFGSRQSDDVTRKVPPLHRSSLCDDLFRSG